MPQHTLHKNKHQGQLSNKYLQGFGPTWAQAAVSKGISQKMYKKFLISMPVHTAGTQAKLTGYLRQAIQTQYRFLSQ